MGVQGTPYQDNWNKMRQLQGTVILETNFILIYVLKYIFLSSNILSISLYIIAWKMRNLNKRNILTATESINPLALELDIPPTSLPAGRWPAGNLVGALYHKL